MQKFLPRILFGFITLVGFLILPASSFASHTTFQIPTISLPPIPTVDVSWSTQQATQIINGVIQPTSGAQPTAKPSPTPTKSISVTPIIIRYSSPTPSVSKAPVQPTVMPTSKPANTVTPTQSTTSSDDKKTFIMNAINDYRRQNGLYSVKTSAETCAFAGVRAKEITTGFNHDRFRNRINANTIPYKTWSSVTENLAMTSNYKQVVTMWINSAGHAANMRKDTPFVCVESSGNYYAYEGMKP